MNGDDDDDKIKHKQPVVDHLTAFHSFTSCYLFKL